MNHLYDTMKKDFAANSGNYEVNLFLCCFRIGHYFKSKMSKGGIFLLLFPLRLLSHLIYKILSTVYLMEIPLGTNIGAGLTIYHLKGIVINSDAIIGKNVVLNHFVTLGEEVTVGDGVIINPLSVVVKGVIGENSIIGAGSVVTKDVEKNTVVGGCPAKLIKSNKTS